MDASDPFVLPAAWSVSTHHDHDKWDEASYIPIYKVKSLTDYGHLLSLLHYDSIFACNDVYIMREPHKPIWEDSLHRAGGKISWKITNNVEHLYFIMKNMIPWILAGTACSTVAANDGLVGVVVMTKPIRHGNMLDNDIQVWFKNDAWKAAGFRPEILALFDGLMPCKSQSFAAAIENDSAPKPARGGGGTAPRR